MTLPQYPLINSTRHSWASLEAKFNGQIYVGFSGITYSDSLDPESVYGTGVEPLGETDGEYSAEGSVEFLLAEFYHFTAALGPGYKMVHFDVTVSYTAAGIATITDELIGCRIKKVNADQKRGPTGIVRPCDLYIRKILWNGLDSVASPLVGIGA
jgi:hypothetical protein